MNPKVILLILIFYFSIQSTISRGGRGGGSRGGGFRSSRSGSSRSGSYSRSGSSGRIGSSVKYSSWSVRRGFSPSFRYKTTSYSYKRTGIYSGFIIMSPYQHRTFNIHNDRAYDDISICYNEYPLYNRNITQSPWFVCPWIDPSYRYCCGDEDEERCCRYFDRPGHLAGLIIGLLIMIMIIVLMWHCLCRRKSRHHKSSSDIVMYDAGSPETVEKVENLPYYQYPTQAPIQPDDTCPPYVANPGAPPYPTDPGAPYPVPGAPYPVPGAPGAPHDAMPAMPNQGAQMYPTYGPPNPEPTPSAPGSGYDESGPTYSLIPTKPPPSYSEVVRN